MKQFIDDHFAVMVVMMVFVMLFGAYIGEVHFGNKLNTLDWLEGEMKETIGALLMGLTAAARQALKTPDPPKVP